jgi:hypothetical protein
MHNSDQRHRRTATREAQRRCWRQLQTLERIVVQRYFANRLFVCREAQFDEFGIIIIAIFADSQDAVFIDLCNTVCERNAVTTIDYFSSSFCLVHDCDCDFGFRQGLRFEFIHRTSNNKNRRITKSNTHLLFSIRCTTIHQRSSAGAMQR